MARASNRSSQPANGRAAGDHGDISVSTGPIGGGAPIEPATGPEIPLAEPIQPAGPVGLTPFPTDPPIPALPIDPLALHEPIGRPEILGHSKFCSVPLPQGCYQLTIRPNNELAEYQGTLRVDREGGALTASGDLYRYLPRFGGVVAGTVLEPLPVATARTFKGMAHARFKRTIPIYPINRYHSYLKVTGIKLLSLHPPGGTCTATVTAEQYLYTQPAPGFFDGTFSPAPGARTITLSLHQVASPTRFGGPYLEGSLYVGGADSGTVSMTWVSKYFRKCTIEIDTLTGAVAPQPVPAHASSRAAAEGKPTEDIRTMLSSAGWDGRIEYDQTAIPVPAGVTATNCWTGAALHALMLGVRKPTTNLDTEWRLHVVVVPAKMGCGRGLMYDTIQVPREGVASFASDGYPSTDSANFGAAANQTQRNTPRAFLRSASHEILHGFNQIHQEGETGADNSIMTTTPSVADVLGGPASGAPGIFPDDIRLEVNEHVRHHLVHMPDICVRPGGMTFGGGHGGTFVPQVDRYVFGADELALTIETAQPDIALGEPLLIRYALTNTGTEPLTVPADIAVESTYATVTVIDPRGRSKEMPPFVMQSEAAGLTTLAPAASLKATTRVYWSTAGFAFTRPGTHVIDVAIKWTTDGVPCLVHGQLTIPVSTPLTVLDDEAATTLMHPQVGAFVALGGGAMHLTEAVARLDSFTGGGRGDGDSRKAGPKALRGYDGLLPPSQIQLDQPRRERVADAPKARTRASSTGAGRRR